MKESPDHFRRLVSEARWDHAIALLRWFDPEIAADAFMSLPLEDQQRLFRAIPVDLAGTLVENLPYYDAYVLLRTRPTDDVHAILASLNPLAHAQLFEDLSDETWRSLTEASVAVPAQVILEARRIEKIFQTPEGGAVQVIAPLDLTLEAGAIVAVLGPSGSGKSTLLRMLSGLTTPSSGEVLWHGKPVSESPPHSAIVFQSFALFPWLTVVENVEVPLSARGLDPSARRQRAVRTLGSVGLKGFENAYPKELSGGMKQRVGFARALAVEPEILFMDEPFSALDVLTAETLRGELVELWLAHTIPTKSIFIVTHNIEEAVLLADRVIVLGRDPGRIRADFAVPLRRHRNRHSHEFLLYVDYIYKLMTQPLVDPEPFVPGVVAADARHALPLAKPGAIAGFLELLTGRGGVDDLYRIAGDLHMEADDLLPLVEAATLLSFAKSERGDVEATPSGVAFAEADITDRKRLFREAALAHVPLLQQMHLALHADRDHTLPLDLFSDLLRKHFSEEEARQQLETALDWGRYGDILIYDAASDRLSLHQQMSSLDDRGDHDSQPAAQ